MSYSVSTTTPAPRGHFIAKFFVDEIVYDLYGRIWKILSISNLTENPLYKCESPLTSSTDQADMVEIKEFYEDSLVKVAESTDYFNSYMNYKILYYEEMLQKIANAKNRLGA